MIRSRRARAVAALAATSLVLAACGGDDDDAADEPADTAADDTAADDTAADEPADTEADEPADTEADDTADTAADDTAADDTAADDEGAADGEPIKIGMLTSQTGNFAPWGLQVQDGMRLAVDDINAAGGVDGRPIELVEHDDQTVAEEGVAGFERLVEEGVIGVGGIISSDIGLATSPIAEELETPLFLVKSGATDILTPDSRYVFRTCLPGAPMVTAPIAEYVTENGITRVGAIIADYGWGRAMEAALQDDLDALDGVEYQIEVAPVPEQDFTTYLRNLEEFDPELIVATGHPPGSGAVTVQSADIGLDLNVIGPWGVWGLVAGGTGEAGIDRYADFDCADFQSDEYQELARRYNEMSETGFMDDDAVAGYGIVTVLAEAAGEVGDDPVAIAEYVHGNTFESPGYAHPLSWTEWGELAEAAPVYSVLGAGPAPDGLNMIGEWYPETLLQASPLEPYMPE